MDLTPHVTALGRELLTAVETGGVEAGAVVERLTASMESAIRLALLEALSAAADEITRELAPGSVQVHLRGRDPKFVVAPQPAERPREDTTEHGTPPVDDVVTGLEDGPAVRLNLRLPEQLKAAFEEAAGKEGRSLNAWLVRAGSTALRATERDHEPDRRGTRSAQRYTGWAGWPSSSSPPLPAGTYFRPTPRGQPCLFSPLRTRSRSPSSSTPVTCRSSRPTGPTPSSRSGRATKPTTPT